MGEWMDDQGIAALNHTLSVSPCCRDVDNRQCRVSNASFCGMAQGTGRERILFARVAVGWMQCELGYECF